MVAVVSGSKPWWYCAFSIFFSFLFKIRAEAFNSLVVECLVWYKPKFLVTRQSVVRQLFQIPSIGQGETNVLLSKMHWLSQLYLCWKTVNTILQMLQSIQHSLKWLTASASQRPRTELAWTLHYLVLKKPPPCHWEHNLREPILCGDFDCIAAPFIMYFMKVRDTAFSVLGFIRFLEQPVSSQPKQKKSLWQQSWKNWRKYIWVCALETMND